MTRVGKLLAAARSPPPLETKCTIGIYKGWYWKVICRRDPDWILWLVTESKHLLPRELEKALVEVLRNLTYE